MRDERELSSLTGLRFIAAFYVFLFHIHIRWPLSNHAFFKNILDQGAGGMSLFFILSGFLLAYRYADTEQTIKDYFTNRVARIYPIYAVAAIVTLPWIGVGFGSGSPADLAKGMGQLALLIVANIFLIQAWFLQFFSYWNNGGSWSISVEAFCYALFPILLPRLSSISKGKLFAIAAACWLLGVLPGLSARLFIAPSNGMFYSMPIFRLPEFLLGVCAYLVIRHGLLYRWGAGLQAAVTAGLVLYLGCAGPEMPLYVGHNWIVLPVITFMIFSLSTGQGPIAALLSSSVFVWLGKISYSFYSFQVLIILLLVKYHDDLTRNFSALNNGKILAAASLVVLLLISASGYYFIEEPARRWIKQYQKKRDIICCKAV